MLNSNYLLKTFLNYLILLFFISSFLIIDPELIIFFSISLVIILSVNELSSFLAKSFNVFFINYYYNFIKVYNLNLYFLYVLHQYHEMALFINSIPFFIKAYNHIISFYSKFMSLVSLNFFSILKYQIAMLIRIFQKKIFKFYFTYFYEYIKQMNTNFPLVDYYNSHYLFDYLYNTIEVSNFENYLVKKNFYLKEIQNYKLNSSFFDIDVLSDDPLDLRNSYYEFGGIHSELSDRPARQPKYVEKKKSTFQLLKEKAIEATMGLAKLVDRFLHG